MKLLDIIILSLAVVFMIIGIHLVITIGFGNAYWAIMLAATFLFIYTYLKRVGNNS